MSDHYRHAELLAQMVPPTQAVAQYVDAAFAAAQRQGLLGHHDIGIRLKQAVDDKSTYGGQAVPQIARYVGISVDRLYKLCAYAGAFSPEQLEQWAARRMSNGGRLSYNHLTALLAVKSAADRLRLIERIFQESLSVRAVRLILAGDRARARRRARKPTTILAGLDQMISSGKGLLDGFSRWRRSVFDPIDNPNRQTIDPLVLARVIEAQRVMAELAAQIEAARNDLTRSLARIDQLIPRD